MSKLVRLLFIGSAFSAARAVDCFNTANSGTSLHLCDRWIVCRDSGGMLCDYQGNLGTHLCVVRDAAPARRRPIWLPIPRPRALGSPTHRSPHALFDRSR